MVFLRTFVLIVSLCANIAGAVILKIVLLFFGAPLYFRSAGNWTRLYCKFLIALLGIRLTVEGDSRYLKRGGNFIISNHLSYIDGVVLASLFAPVFTSKSQVKSWPLFGWLACSSGTIFINRDKKNKSDEYIREVVAMLKRNVNVLVFPEGTSTNGERLLNFQSTHFQAALDAKGTILPIGIRYTKVNQEPLDVHKRDMVCWYGQVKLHKHLLRLARLKSIEVLVKIYPAIELQGAAYAHYNRKELSGLTQRIIQQTYPLFREIL